MTIKIPTTPKNNPSKGFTIVETLLVLSLIGLVSMVFLALPSHWQRIFSTKQTPAVVLQEALQQARLWCAQEHQPATLCFSSKGISLTDREGITIQRFPWPLPTQNATALSYKVLPGILSEKGIFQPDRQAKSIDCIEIQANGFFNSAFVEFESDRGKEQFSVDILTGACQPFSW